MARVLFVVLVALLGVNQTAFGTCYLFKRGDVNNDGVVNSQDLSALYTVLMGGNGPPNRDACDVNDDGVINYSDYSFLINYITYHNVTIPPPFTEALLDPTPDAINCNCDVITPTMRLVD
jgi:hypothetical protein